MIKGVIAGNFDVIHPGYIKMFKEASSNCDCLIVLLHADPSIERLYYSVMGLRAIMPGKHTSRRQKVHRVCPYLLRNLTVTVLIRYGQ